MKTVKPKGEFDSLQSIFADVTASARKDPIERIVVLTYEFDDQQLINLIAGRLLDDDFTLRTNHLRVIAACQPVVIYDARKTREFNQLPHFLDLIAVRASPYSCHHAKAYLIVTRQTVRLVLGSFNLTQTGLFSNREVFMDFRWSDSERANAGVLKAFARLLRDGYADHPQALDSAALDSVVGTIERRLDHWGESAADGSSAADDAYSLLASGYALEGAGTGLQQLAALWRSVSDLPPRKLVVVSPFFDRGRTFLADALETALGPIAEIALYTDADNVAMLSKRHYGSRATQRRLHLIPASIGEAELVRIAAANNDARLGDRAIARKLHAKILILCGEGNRHLVYIGSANFTSKAWNGANHELGLAWTEAGDAERIIAPMLRALGPSATCSYAGLPEQIEEAGEQDALYGGEVGYPDFIERIELDRDDAMIEVRFHFSCADPARLLDYAISWGDVAIVPVRASSQAIRWDASSVPLLGKRNLRFVPRGAVEPVFFLPFYHAPELLQYADLLLFPSSEDWLQHFLQPEGGAGGGGEYIPGEVPEPPEAPAALVDREANVVIAMQRHLTLFSAVETEFARRIAEIVELADVADQLARRVEAPLKLYARLLEKEGGLSAGAIDQQGHSFKLGELALFCRSLGARMPAMIDLSRDLATRLLPRASDPAVLKTYLEYCQDELQ